MCRRLTQSKHEKDYAARFEPELRMLIRDDGGEPSWNVAPSAHPLLMHRFDEDTLQFERVHWGYRPPWAADALLWMDNTLPAQQAEQLVRTMPLSPEFFVWHTVSKEVNKAGNDHPGLVEPV